MTFRRAAAALALTTVMLAGCASDPVAEPSPASPTPSATADLSVPELAFDGDCDAVLDAAQLDEILGPGAVAYDIWWTGLYPSGVLAPELHAEGSLGGIECEWVAADGAEGLPSGMRSIGVLVIPADQVPEEFTTRYEAAACEPSYDATLCRLARTENGAWIMARAGWELTSPPEAQLSAAIDAVAENIASGLDARAAERQDDWWEPAACEQLGDAMALEEVLGANFITGYWEGSAQPEDLLLDAAGAQRHCPWFSDSASLTDPDDFRIVSVTVAPGGAWRWEAIAADPDAEQITIAGATAAVAVRTGPESARVYATDGVNVLRVSADDADVGADIGARAIAALSSATTGGMRTTLRGEVSTLSPPSHHAISQPAREALL